ncbi:hypothetical protein AAG570_011275 [Ranatra chinensis]|uniref:Prefoldin subunit 2 n=1 Tax=Ranatra chinensis TaxID=642074 RepID=A0ABD0YYG7_9HEMI
MATDTKKSAKGSKSKTPTPAEIYNGFQTLRNEQRNLINKLSEVDIDLNEHKIVIDTLKDLDGSRKCFRLIGGVLCEKTVGDILPGLINTKEQLTVLSETLNEQVNKKGVEINDYKEKYDIRIRVQDELPIAAEGEDQKSEPSRNVIAVNPV